MQKRMQSVPDCSFHPHSSLRMRVASATDSFMADCPGVIAKVTGPECVGREGAGGLMCAIITSGGNL